MRAHRLQVEIEGSQIPAITVPSDVPDGPAEVIVLFPEGTPEKMGNGPAILKALEEGPHPPAGFWIGAAEEIRQMRDEWDDE